MRGAPGRRPTSLVAGALPLALCALAGCLDAAPPGWLLESPRVVLVETVVVETGPYSTPLSEDPPGRTRRDGLPGDRVEVRVTIIGPEGPITPSAPPILLRTAFPVLAGWLGDGRPACADDGLDGESTCRIDGDTVTLPPVPPVGAPFNVYVYSIVSRDEGPGREACFRGLVARGDHDLDGCHIHGLPLDYGPPGKVAELRGEESEIDWGNDYNLSSAWIDLSIRGEGDPRELRADDGDVVITAPGETITATLAVSEDESSYLASDARWWATSLTAAITGYQPNEVVLDAPARGHDYWLYGRVGAQNRGRLVSLHFVTPEGGEPSP